eukprot:3859432-Pleurochrysis_carterae.AAC.2
MSEASSEFSSHLVRCGQARNLVRRACSVLLMRWSCPRCEPTSITRLSKVEERHCKAKINHSSMWKGLALNGSWGVCVMASVARTDQPMEDIGNSPWKILTAKFALLG